MHIEWFRCHTYDDAKNFRRVIYLHEWNGLPFYWGKADNSSFGTRYNPGYRHWIVGCLRHGGRLYIGQIKDLGHYSLDDIEAFLIGMYGSELNSRVKAHKPINDLTHGGNVPESIERGHPLTSRSSGRSP